MSRDIWLTIIIVMVAATILILQIWALWFYPTPAAYGQEIEEAPTTTTTTNSTTTAYAVTIIPY